MAVWLRSGVSKYKWHAERPARPWTTYCGRYVNPMFEPARAVSDAPPMDFNGVCLKCLRASEMQSRKDEKGAR